MKQIILTFEDEIILSKSIPMIEDELSLYNITRGIDYSLEVKEVK